MKNKILILGSFDFPDKDAAAKRVLGFGLYLKEKMYDVMYLSWGNSGRTEDFVNDNLFNYKGFNYIPMNEFKKSRNIFKRLYNFIFMGSSTIKYLKTINTSSIDTIIAYNAPSIFLLKLNKFCKKNNIQLILDCTEWYNYNHLTGGKFGPLAIDTSIRMNLINSYIGKLIVVSRYLSEFYKNKVTDLIEIPFLIDMNLNLKNSLHNKIFKQPVKLVYIGSPGKKDKFEIIFNSLNKINKDDILFTLDIYGITKEDYLNINNSFNKEYLDNEYIIFKGRINQDKVDDVYKNYHFSIILRPNERYAKAGFPTKLVESFSNGVPVLASNVGDLPIYVKNDFSGYIIDSLDEKVLERVLNKILSLNQDSYINMAVNSYNLALNKFYYKNNKTFSDFIIRK